MKRLLAFFAVVFIFSFSFQSSTFAAEPKYSCHYDAVPSNYYGQDMCKNHGYIYSTPKDAANALGEAQREFWMASWGSQFFQYDFADPTCSDHSGNGSVWLCMSEERVVYKDNDGKLVFGQWLTLYLYVTVETPCSATVILKGSEGTVLPPNADGKRFVLSSNPGDTVCTNSCSYSFNNTDKCYLNIGSETDGFCNYNYNLVLDDSGSQTKCATDPSIKLGEIGDELTDECPEGFEFANGSKQCTPIPTDPGGGGSGGGGTGGGSGSDGGGGTGGGSGGDGSTGGGSGGDGSTGGGSGGDGGTGDGSGGSGGSGGGSGGSGGSGGDGSTGGGSGDGSSDNETFTSPGLLDLSTAVAGREAQAKAQFIEMKQKMVESNTYTTAKNAFDGFSHASAICPVGSVNLFSQEIVFDSHCKLFDQIAPILTAVFIAIWSFLAVRIVLSA